MASVAITWWGLVWANLFRKRTRTTLTFASQVIAFLLFMLLRAIAAAFSGGVSLVGVDRLVVDAKYSMTDNLPLSHVQQIRALDGVDEVTNMSWFGGFYQDPKNSFAKYPVDPRSYFDVYEEKLIEPEVLEKFAATRTAAVASRSLAESYGWKVGDRIPIQGDIWPKEDGSWAWEFELVGTFTYADDQADVPLFLLRYDYFNESVAAWAKNQVGWLAVRVDDASQVQGVARSIDALYENSSDPTRTVSADEYSRAYARQLGDMGFITTMILSAVFFTMVLLTGNTATQTFRERIPELAVLKTLGFTDLGVCALVLGEAVLLCLVGACVGITLALLLEPALNTGLVSALGRFEMSWQSIVLGIALSVVIGLAVGAQPAWAARRLAIVDALRERA